CSRPCLRCGKPVKRPDRRKFCSHLCAEKWMVGPRASVWKGGSTKGRSKNSARQRKWARAVFERDKFRCQVCGSNRKLNAHHIKPYSTHPRLRFVVSNGKTLCGECHSAVHGFKPMNRDSVCVDCGKRCTNKNRQGKPRCRSCGVKRWHALGRPSEQENTEKLRQQTLPF
ncbi:MAG: HNH endonuclease, partial [Patescibacteria group bacterium]|nr:HNH endonuclease [Patescibacteria group bacterium]